MAGAAHGADHRLFRQVLGRFASGVTVITTRAGDGVHGMTASAFMSGSLEPPLVAISVARKARLHAMIEASGVFGVSILSAHQELHSRHFGGQSNDACAPRFSFHDGIPVLEGALASIAAAVEHIYECGDHSLFLGRVRHLDFNEGDPLVYFTGAYRALARA